MIKSKDILSKTGNVIDLNGENINKLTNVTLECMNTLIGVAEDILNLNYIDDRIGIQLDQYGSQFDIYRLKDMDDDTYRNYIKAHIYIRNKGGTFNDIVNSLAIMFKLDTKQVKVYESEIPRRIKMISISSYINKDILLDFIKKVKAAGIILECYEFIINELNYEYDYTEYDDFLSQYAVARKYKINCRGEITDITDYKELNYEYDLHEYPLDELKDINDI